MEGGDWVGGDRHEEVTWVVHMRSADGGKAVDWSGSRATGHVIYQLHWHTIAACSARQGCGWCTGTMQACRPVQEVSTVVVVARCNWSAALLE